MICEVCQTENATVHLTDFFLGKMRKADLCEVCLPEKRRVDDMALLADWNDLDNLPNLDTMVDFGLVDLVLEPKPRS